MFEALTQKNSCFSNKSKILYTILQRKTTTIPNDIELIFSVLSPKRRPREDQQLSGDNAGLLGQHNVQDQSGHQYISGEKK